MKSGRSEDRRLPVPQKITNKRKREKMSDDYTHIFVLVDRSGSMQNIAQEAEGSIRAFLEEQAVQPGKLTVTLAEFDSTYDVPMAFGEDPFVELDDWTLKPRGMTALNDAIARVVNDTSKTIEAMTVANKPDKVVGVIVTDGLENTSKKWTAEDVKELVTAQTSQHGWQFIYLAANQDAILEGQARGIMNNTNYDATNMGTRAVYDMVTNSVSAFRSGSTSQIKVDEKV